MMRVLITAGPIMATNAAVSQAIASQGPGTGVGSASIALQTAMMFAVYGGCAAVLALAALSALRRR